MLRGLAAGHGLGEIDILLAREGLGSDIFLADKLRIAGRDVHGDIVHQFLEVVGAGHEIALAVDLHQHADLAAGVDVACHRAFAGHARAFFGRDRDAALAQNDDGLLQVALGLGEGLLAIHHRRARLVAEFFYLRCRDIHCGCAHFLKIVPSWMPDPEARMRYPAIHRHR